VEVSTTEVMACSVCGVGARSEDVDPRSVRSSRME